MDDTHLKKLTNHLKESFKDQLKAILVYGSILRKGESADIDILVILKEKNVSSDFKKFKAVNDAFTGGVLDMQLMYEEEIASPKLFSLDAHGSFFVEVLKHAKAVYGENPFDNIVVSPEDRQRSALNKIQNYMFRARQEAMGLGRHSKDANPFYHRKKIIRVMDDIMIFDGELGNREKLLDRFVETYPEVLFSGDLEILSQNKVFPIDEYIKIYEKLYSFALKKANIHIPILEQKARRVKFGEIVSEFIHVEGSKKAMIILEGLPSVPDEKRVLNIFANLGYSVFYPRYKGTWESDGQFLKESPVKDLEQIVDALVNGVESMMGELKFEEITIIASSFGGSVALSIKDRPELQKILVLSPVYDYKNMPSLESLSGFMRKMFTQAYRYEESDWDKVLSGELIDPSRELRNFPSKDKIVIFAGEKDKDIPVNKLEEFAEKQGLAFCSFKNRGHLSYSQLAEEVLEKALLVL